MVEGKIKRKKRKILQICGAIIISLDATLLNFSKLPYFKALFPAMSMDIQLLFFNIIWIKNIQCRQTFPRSSSIIVINCQMILIFTDITHRRHISLLQSCIYIYHLKFYSTSNNIQSQDGNSRIPLHIKPQKAGKKWLLPIFCQSHYFKFYNRFTVQICFFFLSWSMCCDSILFLWYKFVFLCIKLDHYINLDLFFLCQVLAPWKRPRKFAFWWCLSSTINIESRTKSNNWRASWI